MPQTLLWRRASFSCGRQLRHPDWDAARNRAAFGRDTQPHGHDYVLDAAYAGLVNECDGMVVNLIEVKPVLAEAVAALDGKWLPDQVLWFEKRRPSLENVTEFLWQELPGHTGPATLARLHLRESSRLCAQFDGLLMQLTRSYEFASAHRLHSAAMSEDENQRLYGKCSNPAGHGHNYGLEVTVSGPADEDTGFLVPRALLDQVVEEEVFARFDHRHLNLDCPEFALRVPTSENLAQVLFEVLQERLAREGFRLARIGLHETQKNFFEVMA